MLSDSAIDIYAAQAMINDCAALIDAGAEAMAETSIVKAFCTEMVGRVVDRAIQVHGGMGLANETGLEAAFRTARSEEHTSELQSLMRISYAVFCLKKKNTKENTSKQVQNGTNKENN